MPGPKKTPTNLKVLTGTVRKDRLPAGTVSTQLVREVPDPPDWLPNAHAVKEWHRLAAVLVANKQLTEGGLNPLGMLCALTGRLVQLWSAGEMPTANMLGQWRALVNDFGLTRACDPQAVDHGNAFQHNGKRRG